MLLKGLGGIKNTNYPLEILINPIVILCFANVVKNAIGALIANQRQHRLKISASIGIRLAALSFCDPNLTLF
jgi:dipeptide/tripeptide permease